MGTKVKDVAVRLYYGKGVMPARGTKALRAAYQGDHASIENATYEAKDLQVKRAVDWWVILTDNYRWHSSWSSL